MEICPPEIKVNKNRLFAHLCEYHPQINGTYALTYSSFCSPDGYDVTPSRTLVKNHGNIFPEKSVKTFIGLLDFEETLFPSINHFIGFVDMQIRMIPFCLLSVCLFDRGGFQILHEFIVFCEFRGEKKRTGN